MKIKPGPGEYVGDVAKRMVLLAIEHNTRVEADFNDTLIWAEPDSSASQVVARFSAEREKLDEGRTAKRLQMERAYPLLIAAAGRTLAYLKAIDQARTVWPELEEALRAAGKEDL